MLVMIKLKSLKRVTEGCPEAEWQPVAAERQIYRAGETAHPPSALEAAGVKHRKADGTRLKTKNGEDILKLGHS